MTTRAPHDDKALAELSFAHLQSVVAIDSQSDETSTTIPSTEGQRRLAEFVAEHFAACGFSIERDAMANVIASRSGRKGGLPTSGVAPLALMVHLDTARGTGHPAGLHRHGPWDGQRVPFPQNPTICVDTAHYPMLSAFLGHTLVHGDGREPFGLDDKLGLTHLMTLARLIADDPSIDHPPLFIIGRPDEEIGRMEAVESLADELARRGITSGYTVDGILPFEVNVANFNAAHASVTFTGRQVGLAPDLDERVSIRLCGVNTHGATAHAEGHRTAVRFAAELVAELRARGVAIHPAAFTSDPVRDCDGTLVLLTRRRDRALIEQATGDVVGPHIPRGASFSLSASPLAAEAGPYRDTVEQLLASVSAFAASKPADTFPLWAEDSSGWQGYSHAYRARPTSTIIENLEDRADEAEPGSLILDVRIRDFDPELLAARKHHVASFFAAREPAPEVALRDQYVNMAPRLADRMDLVERALLAGRAIGVEVVQQPIRGGTGVDPFLDRGTAVANLGTGYFAPESEKELTTLELMARHARWLLALCAAFA